MGKGISLVICTNRGILEKVNTGTIIREITNINQQLWFIITKSLVNAIEPSGTVGNNYNFSKDNSRRTVFSQVKIGYITSTTMPSWLRGEDTFDHLIKKQLAVNFGVVACPVLNLCPFKANRDWLADLDARKRFYNY